AQVSELDADSLDLRQQRRRAWLRIGVPIGGVALIIASILAIALYADRADRRGVLLLSDDLLSALESRIAQQVIGYLEPADRAVLIARDIVQDGGALDRRALAQAYAASALRNDPQIFQLSFASPEGNFMLARRDENGGTAIKLIRNEPKPRLVLWIYQDADGRETAQTTDPSDEYDPRTRPWYEGALKGDGVFWTGVYIFATAGTPGVTASVRYTAPDGRTFVFGVDIALKALSEFLASLQIGRTGRALIFDDSGHLIAAPESIRVLQQHAPELLVARLDELGDPILTAAYDRFRLEGYGRRVVEVNGVRQIIMVSKLPVPGNNWSVLIVVPEAEFTGFIAANSRTALAMSMVIVAVAALFAGLLVRYGLRADRAARLLLDRTRAIERQSTAFAALATEAGLFTARDDRPARGLTEALGAFCLARRASVWRLLSGKQVLRCEDSFESESGGHVAGLELSHEEAPQFFNCLVRGDEIDAADAARDRRTAPLYRTLMSPLGSRSLLAVPIRRETDVVGAIGLEDPASLSESLVFARAVANMIAVRMGESVDTAPKPQRIPTLRCEEPSTAYSAATELCQHGIDPATTGAEVFPNLAVMVAQFPEPAAMAHRLGAGPSTLADYITQALQEIGKDYDIPYLKLLGEEVMAAAGFGSADASAAERVAEAGLAIRDRCTALFETAELSPAFHIGIDCGLALGSLVGQAPRLFNLWGDAVSTAQIMAGSAPSCAIQVTEAAYRRVAQHFLLRPRGSFYLPRIGAVRTFVLAGRL
ncbi:MAG: GAF domain-containing protein, partial [Acetobacteraceae bacterium]|nr:GAF domain-containing protein [Acetobacteraceae bacterium]